MQLLHDEKAYGDLFEKEFPSPQEEEIKIDIERRSSIVKKGRSIAAIASRKKLL